MPTNCNVGQCDNAQSLNPDERYGKFRCAKADRDIVNKDGFPFPEWCPLTEDERR